VRRVTADTNVLVSGLMYRRGKSFQLLHMALAGEISLTVSQPIIDETLDVLERKFGITLPGRPKRNALAASPAGRSYDGWS
jgi:predicted nucleic acid-binding protein